MTGIGMAAASGATAAVPLTCSVSLTSSSGTDNVSGAAGDLYTWSGGTHLVSVLISGGSGSYPTVTLAFVSDGNTGGSSASMGLSSDGVHQTIFWTGAAIGNSMLYHLTLNVTDSLGATASAVWPSAGSALIDRTT